MAYVDELNLKLKLKSKFKLERNEKLKTETPIRTKSKQEAKMKWHRPCGEPNRKQKIDTKCSEIDTKAKKLENWKYWYKKSK